MFHYYELMGTNESEKIEIYFQGFGDNKYCNARIMHWPPVHDIISKCPVVSFSVMLLSS